MKPTSHRLKRQTLDLEVPTLALARRVQDEISWMQVRRIVPILERVCDEVGQPGTLHRLERVEVDLGEIPAGDLANTMCVRLESALRRTLSARIADDQARVHGQPRSARLASALELFVLFARSGTLPWWADVDQPRLLATNADELLKAAPGELAAVIARLVAEPTVLRRIVRTYDDAVLARFCRLIVGDSEARALGALPAAITQHARELGLALDLPLMRLRDVVWQCALRVAVRWSAMSAEPTGAALVLCRSALDELATVAPTSHRALSVSGVMRAAVATVASKILHRAVDGFLDTTTHARRSDAALVADIDRATVSDTASMATDDDVDSARRTGKRDGPRDDDGTTALTHPHTRANERTARLGPRADTTRRQHRQVADHRQNSAQPIAELFSEPDELYVHDAGICLLWPFLPGFFNERNLLQERDFATEESRRHAVLLLAHLATGASVAAEYSLPLAKLLCGVEIDEFIECGEPLGDDDLAASADLLTAVIGQAPILSDMSIAFFRHNFLVRDGVLSSQDGLWLLKVHRETHDIVLDQLPWSFAWVALPWMAAPLRIQWR